MLYRHWTLYDSMYYSNYVATKLGVWKQRGDFELLAVCCTLCCPSWLADIPPHPHNHTHTHTHRPRCVESVYHTHGHPCEGDHAKVSPSAPTHPFLPSLLTPPTPTRFAAMSRSAVLTLKANLDREAAAFDLPEIEYNSFEFRTGYSQPVCAADVAYAVEALLECASLKAAVSSAAAAGTPSASTGSGAGGGAGGGAGAGAGGNGGGGGISGGDSSGAGFAWEDNFTVAYNALSLYVSCLHMVCETLCCSPPLPPHHCLGRVLQQAARLADARCAPGHGPAACSGAAWHSSACQERGDQREPLSIRHGDQPGGRRCTHLYTAHGACTPGSIPCGRQASEWCLLGFVVPLPRAPCLTSSPTCCHRRHKASGRASMQSRCWCAR